MTHLKIEQNNGVTEEVSSDVISKLYDIVHSGNLDQTSNLIGRLHTTATYQDYIDYLEDTFKVNNVKQLIIDATKKYIRFVDPEVQRVLATEYGDGVGVTQSELESVNEILQLFKGNTNITSFNEFKYFTGINHPDVYWQADWFTGCTNLREITIPKNVVDMRSDNGVFNGCTSLQTVTFDPVSSVKSLSGFLNCTSLVNISIPDSVQTIEGNCFYNCSSLQTIDTKNATILGGNAFKMCSSLTSATMLNAEEINNECFYADSNLTSINFNSNKITALRTDAFAECSKLVINDLSLPNLETLGSGVFSKTKIKAVSNLGTQITSIPAHLFSQCSQLTSVTLPQQVTSIGNNAFYGCSALTTVIGINNITSLGENAFNACTSLGTNQTLELNLTNQYFYPDDALRGTKYKRLILHSPQWTNDNWRDPRYPVYEDMRDLEYLDLSDWLTTGSAFNHSQYGDCSFYNNNALVTYIAPANINHIDVIIGQLGSYSNFRYLILLATTPPTITTTENNSLPTEWFYNKSGNVHIYVPDSAKAAYLADADWSTIGGYNGSDTIADRLHGLSELPNGVWTTGLASQYLTPAQLATS